MVRIIDRPLTAEVAPPWTTHWLFCKVVDEPSVTEVEPVPLSPVSEIVFAGMFQTT